jgi:hypothetical protein
MDGNVGRLVVETRPPLTDSDVNVRSQSTTVLANTIVFQVQIIIIIRHVRVKELLRASDAPIHVRVILIQQRTFGESQSLT